MPRRCYVCGSRYLGSGQCSVVGCPRNTSRLHDIRRVQRPFAPPTPAPPTPRAAPSEAEPDAERDPHDITLEDLRISASVLLDVVELWVRANECAPDDQAFLDDVTDMAQLMGLAVVRRGTRSNG